MEEVTLIRPLLIGLAAAGLVNAQTNTATGSVATRVINPLSITRTADLNFGTIVSPTLQSVIKIAPVQNSGPGTRTLDSGNAQFVDGTFSQATFTVQGAPNAMFYVSPVPAASISAGNHNMPVTFYSISYQDQFPGPNPVVTLYIGASLTIGAFQPKGNYSGTFTVQVNYP
jgi:hypothetical protein